MKQFKDGMGGNGGSDNSDGVHRVGPAQLGVHVQDLNDNSRKQFHIPSGATGAVVISVLPDSVADKLGMKSGDVIQGIGDTEVKSAHDVQNAMSGVNWGDTKKVTYVRFGETTSIKQDRDVKFK
jgi:serine protease Do